MFSDKTDKLWNKFSGEEKSAINLRYKTLHAEYMTLQEIRVYPRRRGETVGH